jgi:hypothetical protein
LIICGHVLNIRHAERIYNDIKKHGGHAMAARVGLLRVKESKRPHPFRLVFNANELTHIVVGRDGTPKHVSDMLLKLFKKSKDTLPVSVPVIRNQWMTECLESGSCLSAEKRRVKKPLEPMEATPLDLSSCDSEDKAAGFDPSAPEGLEGEASWEVFVCEKHALFSLYCYTPANAEVCQRLEFWGAGGCNVQVRVFCYYY